jgi:hypothetical protein
MNIRVTLTIEVDANGWRETYGPESVREDVKGYVVNQIQQSAATDEGVLLSVTAQ